MASKWTDKEIALLRELYPDYQNIVLVDKIGRPYSGIASKAKSLGIRKSEAFFSDPVLSGRNLQNCCKQTQFKKGNKPHNIGKKLEEWMPQKTIEKFKKTQFKKGNDPHNSLPVGTEVLRIDKRSGKHYWMVKVEGFKSLVYKHVYIFENHHKLKVKRGENVIFKDGNTNNLSIDNLECITNVELMERNTLHRYPEDLKKQIRKISKLKKIIKKIEHGKN
jgi:hypothetical protein